MYNGISILRPPSCWFVCITFVYISLSSCKGQHYFFEEIKKVADNSTAGYGDGGKYNGEQDTFISFENATLVQDEEPRESILEKIKFPEFYHAQGIISLPYDGIIEPFEAWYAGKHQMSRIDYYYGNQLLLTLVRRCLQVEHCLPFSSFNVFIFNALSSLNAKRTMKWSSIIWWHRRAISQIRYICNRV